MRERICSVHKCPILEHSRYALEIEFVFLGQRISKVLSLKILIPKRVTVCIQVYSFGRHLGILLVCEDETEGKNRYDLVLELYTLNKGTDTYDQF